MQTSNAEHRTSNAEPIRLRSGQAPTSNAERILRLCGPGAVIGAALPFLAEYGGFNIFALAVGFAGIAYAGYQVLYRERRRFDEWMQEVKRIAELMGWGKTAIDSIDEEAWKEYFNDGLSPSQAWSEELSYGS